MEEVKLPIHEHLLLPITRFSRADCKGCGRGYIYGGYRCNELGCEAVFHRECAESLPEITHSSHPHHPLKLRQGHNRHRCFECRYGDGTCSTCSRCGQWFENGYICFKCVRFKLDLRCAKRPDPLLILENSNLHEHPLELFSSVGDSDCKKCDSPVLKNNQCYGCNPCGFFIHVRHAEFVPGTNHTSHPQHPLKLLKFDEAHDYTDKECLLCESELHHFHPLHHCDVCNFSICENCMNNPPPVSVVSPTTHEHELHLVPRRIKFTCNACGTLGDRSPYFCLQCNFMIHWECIDLPRVININRHEHRISYTRLLGHGEWKCRVCRKKVDGFYGAYTCVRKCPGFAVHSLCATGYKVWDMMELEGTPDDEEDAPFELVDDKTIKHFSHDHNLQINNNGHGRIQPENRVCEACVSQILSEPFYSCMECNFILHKKCANHPRKKRHIIHNQPFTLHTDSRHKVDRCKLCDQFFTGFRYIASKREYSDVIIDVRCAAISDTLEHGSHQHPLYFTSSDFRSKRFSCDECDYSLGGKCAYLPEKVMKIRYDDHPLFLSFGDMNMDSDYWCEACETKVNPKEWFYTCNECGTILHVSCVVGDFSYIMPGSITEFCVIDDPEWSHLMPTNEEVVSNTSICRPLCSGKNCNSRCKLPSILKISNHGVDEYFCSCSCNFYGDY